MTVTSVEGSVPSGVMPTQSERALPWSCFRFHDRSRFRHCLCLLRRQQPGDPSQGSGREACALARVLTVHQDHSAPGRSLAPPCPSGAPAATAQPGRSGPTHSAPVPPPYLLAALSLVRPLPPSSCSRKLSRGFTTGAPESHRLPTERLCGGTDRCAVAMRRQPVSEGW